MLSTLTSHGTGMILLVTTAISLMGLYLSPQIIEKCVFRPYVFWRRQHYDTIYLSGFVHKDFAHLLFNMLSLYFFGYALEARIGTTALVLGYLLALVASELPVLYKHRHNRDYATLGASGAVTAVIFAYIVLDPTSTLFILPIPVPIPAALYALVYLGYSYYAAKNRNDGINHDAHLWGALFGLAWVLVCEPTAVLHLLRGEFG